MNRLLSTRQGQPRSAFSLELVSERPGFILLSITGKRARTVFGDEGGGHRWQRIPPSEKRGRVHTSTVTVAVLSEPAAQEFSVAKDDVEERVARGSGPGGQARNKLETAITLTHKPTGITVRSDNSRSQGKNRELAWRELTARLWQRAQDAQHALRAADRKGQVGSGMRGDKRRTIRTQDGRVTDHVTGKTWTLKQYLRGEW